MDEGHANPVATRAASDASQTAPRVLVPTEFSKDDEPAFEHGLRLAVAMQARLTLLHCGPEGREQVPWDRFPSVRGTLVRWGMLPPDAPRSEVAARVGIAVNKMAVRDEDPRQGIVEHLRRNPSEIVVMSSQGRTGLARVFDASRAETVAYRGRTPALILPRSSQGFVDPATGAGRLRRVLCALDYTHDQRNALAFLSRWLPALGSGNIEATVLQLCEPGQGASLLFPNTPGLQWQNDYRPLEAVAAILDGAREAAFDLVVLNAQERLTLRGRMRGSQLDRVMRDLGTAVMTLPIR